MPARLRLEDFDTPAPQIVDAPAPMAADPGLVEDVRLEAYEKGYSAGWEDAVAAQSDDQTKIREDLAQNLRDLSFTYQEARAHLLRSLDPLLRGMADRVLPEIAHATLGATVVAQLIAEAETLASVPIEITICPENREAIEAALGEQPAMPVTLVDEPTLASGQVHFRFGEEERAMDLDAIVSAIRALVDDFLNSSDERQASHG